MKLIRAASVMAVVVLGCGDRNNPGTDSSALPDSAMCPPCVAPPNPACVGSGPCGCGPYLCPDGGTDSGTDGATDAGATDAATPGNRGSLSFVLNGAAAHEYGLQLAIPPGFGDGELTLELWIRPDDSYPVGSTSSGGSDQLMNWSDADNMPYSSTSWWFDGNFLLDGHNNNGDFTDGTFSLQLYGGGRLRWLFGDGVAAPGSGGPWNVGVYPATGTSSLLDGQWHQVTLVRRWSGTGSADLEMWIDGALVDTETSSARTDMRTFWDSWPGWQAGQEGWFWGAEKQAAIGVLTQYEDYKGLLAELRFWSRPKTPAEISSDWGAAVTGSEMGLVGYFPFDEGSGTQACDLLDPTRCMDLLGPTPPAWSADVPALTAP